MDTWIYFGNSIFTLPQLKTDATCRYIGAHGHVTEQIIAYHRQVTYEQSSQV
jgi:CRISPR/Cas system CSM-associated protein Csm2 small subunit